MKPKSLLLTLSTAGLLAAGCSHPGGAYDAVNGAKYNNEDRERIVLLDSRVQTSVTWSDLQEKRLDDGRLEVFANLRNREERRIQVQMNCVFKDAQGFSTGDETPFRNLILSENGQETVHFVSMNNLAKKYTIRVREAH